MLRDIVDCVLTFEEMQAMFNANIIALESLEETPLDNASYFERIFAHSGGLSTAALDRKVVKTSLLSL